MYRRWHNSGFISVSKTSHNSAKEHHEKCLVGVWALVLSVEYHHIPCLGRFSERQNYLHMHSSVMATPHFRIQLYACMEIANHLMQARGCSLLEYFMCFWSKILALNLSNWHQVLFFPFYLYTLSITAPQDAHKRLVLQGAEWLTVSYSRMS